MVSPQASPGAQVRGGRARTHAAAGSLPGGPPGPRGVVLIRGPAASHLPGGRSAAPPPPSRSPDPSFARRPGGCRAGGIMAIAAASAHPGSRGEPGRGGAVTETPRAPPPPLDTRAPCPACPRAPAALRASWGTRAGSSRRRDLRPPRRLVSGAPFCRSGSGGSLRLARAGIWRKRGADWVGRRAKVGAPMAHSVIHGGLGLREWGPWTWPVVASRRSQRGPGPFLGFWPARRRPPLPIPGASKCACLAPLYAAGSTLLPD